MFSETQNLDLTRKDLELIEAALHTQQKILAVQSEAGGANARAHLTDVKHLIKRLSRQAPRDPRVPAPSWSQMARSFFCSASA